MHSSVPLFAAHCKVITVVDKAVVSPHVLQNFVFRFQFSVRETGSQNCSNCTFIIHTLSFGAQIMFAFARLYRFT